MLIFHDIEKKNFKKFEILLNFIIKNFYILTPEEFKISFKRKLNQIKNKKKILITFDDGYKSQKQIAEKYLNPNNLKALFFLVSDFITINNKIKQSYLLRIIFIKIKIKIILFWMMVLKI